MRRKTDKSKARDNRGSGVLGEYRPWIVVGEEGSSGTASNPIDWKTGRMVHLLSQIEMYAWYLFRFRDDVVDINEQYPLDIADTKLIAQKLGYKHPASPKTNEDIVMTTDLKVTMTDGSVLAVSVKPDGRYKNNRRTMEKMAIEKEYWEKKGAQFITVTRGNINKTEANNIRFIVLFYNIDPAYQNDDVSILKHLIARKYIRTDLKQPMHFPALVQLYRKEIEEWKTLHCK